jgi:hypothetical protein
MTDREAMQQALEALIKAHPYSNSNKDLDGHSEAIAALRERLAQPERIQLTVRDFVVTVGDIEDAVGTPMYWAEWPNKEQP